MTATHRRSLFVSAPVTMTTGCQPYERNPISELGEHCLLYGRVFKVINAGIEISGKTLFLLLDERFFVFAEKRHGFWHDSCLLFYFILSYFIYLFIYCGCYHFCWLLFFSLSRSFIFSINKYLGCISVRNWKSDFESAD